MRAYYHDSLEEAQETEMSENEAKYGESAPGVIRPTIGRQVWYWKPGSNPAVDQPEAATVAFVHGDSMVNLQVISPLGNSRGVLDVSLRQPPDPQWTPPFAEWMPYQKGQAAKTEQIEQKLSCGFDQKAEG